jgi:ferredoxin
MVEGKELERFQRVVVDQDTCIECGSCIAVCPFQAWEYGEGNKARLIWDKCQDDFSCIAICPVGCIWKSGDAPAETKAKNGWLRFSRGLDGDELGIFEIWRKKYALAVEAKRV